MMSQWKAQQNADLLFSCNRYQMMVCGQLTKGLPSLRPSRATRLGYWRLSWPRYIFTCCVRLRGPSDRYHSRWCASLADNLPDILPLSFATTMHPPLLAQGELDALWATLMEFVTTAVVGDTSSQLDECVADAKRAAKLMVRDMHYLRKFTRELEVAVNKNQ